MITIIDIGYSFYFDLYLDLFYVGSIFILGGYTLRVIDEKNDIKDGNEDLATSENSSSQ